MNTFFFPKTLFLLSSFGFLILWLYPSVFALLVVLLILVFAHFSFRTKEPYGIQEFGIEEKLVAPVDGTVKSVIDDAKNQKKKISISQTFLDRWAIHLPAAGELFERSREDKDLFLGLMLKNNKKIRLIFRKSYISIHPRLYMIPGDRGLLGACIGHRIGGGRLIIEIPFEHKILVRKGQKLKVGRTFLSGPNEKPDNKVIL